MATYRRGSKGPEVARLQERLNELGFYLGPVDGDFGGGTESAVRAFQRDARVVVDGIIGSQTWQSLFGDEPLPRPSIIEETLAYRCLALTGAFETTAPVPECFAGLSGDFDGQGISFGALQWNLGQGSLQPMLVEMDTKHADIVEEIFVEHTDELRAMLAMGRQEQLDWARSIQTPRFRLFEPWQGMFKTVGRRKEYQDIQVSTANSLYDQAVGWCGRFELTTERAVALMFDIRVQNGSISSVVDAQIRRDIAQLADDMGDPEAEVARLRIVANRRAEAANPRWVEDVRRRKLTIANGEGTVHGGFYDLAGQYGIRPQPAEGL